MKEEQTPAGTTQSELKHYSDLFTADKNGAIPKRILVQGQTGIGKSTFVKKLLVDWVEVNKKTGDEKAAVLKNFELVVAVNLKEVSKCQSLKDVITLSNVFAKEDKYMTEGLVDYISNNQEKVLLIFDGYDEYRCGRNSEIYEIFSGNSLRSCCVLMTTRISKADELRGGEDLHAEITGFSEVDRNDFMRRFLNGEEVRKLKNHLYERKLNELAKVPLLLLFLCTLWKKGQSKHFQRTKTKLYTDIIEFVLNHSHSKQSPPHYVEVTSFKEILSEIGKVALQGLLNDDHLFEYSQLSDSVRCDESVFIGLLQITEYSETLRPVGLVSFIHKSIQEFLAAWYVTYRCIPEVGNLGEIGVKLEECLASENVFQFICGLSEDGASTVLRHLKSVRISDPSLDLSKAIPDVENETDEPLSDVTERQEKFRDLVLFSFAEVESKAKLSSSCLDSLGNILLFSDSFPDYLLEKATDANTGSLIFNGGGPPRPQKAFLGSRLGGGENVILNKVVKILFTKGSKFLKVAQFLEEFENICGHCSCNFSSILCFRNDQVFFYITQLKLWCENHARLFTDIVVPPHAVHSTSGRLCLKFLKTLECYSTRFSMESLGAVIKHCNHLERIGCEFDDDNFDSDDSDYDSLVSDDPEFGYLDYDDCFDFDYDDSDAHDSVCHLLEQVPNPGRCSLSIRFCALTSTGAVKLASLLPRFENVILLYLSLVKCSTDAVARLVAAIKHKTLKKLVLLIREINLTSAVVEALCQSLSELSALETLRIGYLDKYSFVADDLVDLDDSWSLPRLRICRLTDSFAEATTRLIDVFDRNIFGELKLQKIHLTPAVTEVLVQLLPKFSALRTLKIRGLTECSDEAVTTLIDGINHKTLVKLELSEMNLTSAAAESLPRLKICRLTDSSAEAITRLIDVFDHNIFRELGLKKIHLTPAVTEVLVQLLPKFSALRTLKIRSFTECSDEAVTRLIDGINRKTLEELELNNMEFTSAAAESLGRWLPELSALETLKIIHLTECSDEPVTRLIDGINRKTLKRLGKMTSAVAESLGRSLPELSALKTLVLRGWGGYVLQQKEMEALFGRFSRPSSLRKLSISCFLARGSLASLAKNLCFFPCLESLELEDLHMGEADLCSFLENLKYIPDLQDLSLINNPLGQAARLMVPYLLQQKKLVRVFFREEDVSEEDLNYLQEAVKEKRPHLRIKVFSHSNREVFHLYTEF